MLDSSIYVMIFTVSHRMRQLSKQSCQREEICFYVESHIAVKNEQSDDKINVSTINRGKVHPSINAHPVFSS